ncbi:lipopolysaccharide biosynthesis protein [Hydrocarboniphaga sp.]|uniref:lipopolysaccharide biosynthesis protein n=1 Tax=Hydrocarboniphaga sp. TaxID=2033016 RepID=UPI002ABA2251|nr:oligosaccharide flippase family protein [Hydrocarboniphaga sp.]MDZ4078355.1 oligosaccharide flippase family protein [Hydrocarboniphaga sp.]
MITKVSLLGITLLSRLAVNIGLFMVLARILSPDVLGKFAYWYSVANLSVLFVDYGFSQSLLRDIGANPKAGQRTLSTALTIKTAAAAIALIVMAFASIFFKFGFFPVLLLIAAITNSFGESAGATLRANGYYSQESIISVCLSGVLLSSIYLLGKMGRFNLLPLAWLIFGFRITMSGTTFLVLKIKLPNYWPYIANISDCKAAIKNGIGYATDVGLTTLSSNLDIVLVKFHLGDAAVSFYQAGQKIVQAASLGAQTLSGVYLPVLANPDSISKHKARLRALLIGAGILFGVAVTMFRDFIVTFLYGTNFSPLAESLPFFSILIFMKFVAAYSGLILTALGRQSRRAMVNAASIIVLIFVFFALPRSLDYSAMIYAQIISVLVVFISYSAIIRAENRHVNKST